MGKKKNRKKREKENIKNQNQTDSKDSTDCVEIINPDQSLKSDLESDPTLNTTLEPTSRSLELYKSIHNIEARLGHQPESKPEMSHPPPGYGFIPPPGIPPVGFPPVPFGMPLPHVPPPMAGLVPPLPPTGLTITIPDDRPRSRERRRSRSRSRDRIRSRGRSRSPVYHGRSNKRGRSRDRTRSPSPYSDRYVSERYAPPTHRPMSPGEESDLIKLREQVFELENVIRLKDEQLNMKEERKRCYVTLKVLHNNYTCSLY